MEAQPVSLSPWFLKQFPFHADQFKKDHLLPYMCDPRHAPDTLFLVCEEDFRLWPTDEDVNLEAVAAAIYAESAEPSGFQEELNAASSSSMPPVRLHRAFNPTTGEPFAPAEEGVEEPESLSPRQADPPTTETWEQRVGAFYSRVPKSERGTEVEPPSQALADIVKMCTLAHRMDCGNFVWLGWCGRTARGYRCKPSNGSALIAVSLKGAVKLARAGQQGKIKKGHIDISLRDFLNEGDNARELGASYVYPAVGNFQEHVSGCDPGIGVRTGLWNETWCQAGTRASDGNGFQDRYLMRWLPKGSGVDWTTKIILPERTPNMLAWKTLRPRDDPEAQEEIRRQQEWLGNPAPPRTTAMERQTMFGADDVPVQPKNKRQRRQLRAQKIGYSLRILVDDPDQVVKVMYSYAVSLSPRLLTSKEWRASPNNGEPFAPL